MSRTPQFSVSWEEFIDNLIEENKKLEDEVKDLVERNIELDKKYMLVLTENKKLEEKIKRLEFDVDAWYQLKLLLEWEIEKLKKENEDWREEKRAMEITLDSLGYWERTY